MNKGGGEKARKAAEVRVGGRGEDRRGVSSMRKKGPPPTPSASKSDAQISILNLRVPVHGEPPALPPRRAVVCDDFACADGEPNDPHIMKGWRGFNDTTFDGLGVVPGASKMLSMSRQNGVSPELLHMPDDTQDLVSHLLRGLRPLGPVVENLEDAALAVEMESMAQRSLTAPTRVSAKAEGLRLARDSDPTKAGVSAKAFRYTKNEILDQLALHEAHAVAQSVATAKETLQKDLRRDNINDRKMRNDRLVRRLVNAGFKKEWSDTATKHVPESVDAFDFAALKFELEADESLTPHQRRQRVLKKEQQATETRVAQTMDWLCLHAPNEELPETFRRVTKEMTAGALAALGRRQRAENAADAAAAVGRDQGKASGSHASGGAEIQSVNGASDAASEDRRALQGTAAREDPHVALLQRAMLARLGHYGFTRVESRAALEKCGWTEQDATYALLRKLHPEEEEGVDDLGRFNENHLARGDAPDSNAKHAAAIAERADEALALASIFESKFAVEHDETLWTIQIDAEDDNVWRPCFLEIHSPPNDLYPISGLPLISVRHANLPPAVKRGVAASLATVAFAEKGAPCVFALIEWLKEFLPAILGEHGVMDEEAMARAAQVAAEKEAKLEQEALASAKRDLGFLQGMTAIERTFAKGELQREAELATLARKKERRAAYLRVLMESEAKTKETGEDDDEEEEEEEEESGDETRQMDVQTMDTEATETETIEATTAASNDQFENANAVKTSIAVPSSDDDVLRNRLDRWEAEHTRRVEAASAAASTAENARGNFLSFEGEVLIQPNAARTKKKEREETAAMVMAMDMTKKEAERAALMATAQGRRSIARSDLYENARADLFRASVSGRENTGDGPKPKNSWLAKHVKSAAIFDKELAEDTDETADGDTIEHDETTLAAAEVLAKGSCGVPKEALRKSAAADASAPRAAQISKRLLRLEKEKQRDKTWVEMQAKVRPGARFPNPSTHCFTEAGDCLSIHRNIQDVNPFSRNNRSAKPSPRSLYEKKLPR
jgi:hypothetical protein